MQARFPAVIPRLVYSLLISGPLGSAIEFTSSLGIHANFASFVQERTKRRVGVADFRLRRRKLLTGSRRKRAAGTCAQARTSIAGRTRLHQRRSPAAAHTRSRRSGACTSRANSRGKSEHAGRASSAFCPSGVRRECVAGASRERGGSAFCFRPARDKFRGARFASSRGDRFRRCHRSGFCRCGAVCECHGRTGADSPASHPSTGARTRSFRARGCGRKAFELCAAFVRDWRRRRACRAERGRAPRGRIEARRIPLREIDDTPASSGPRTRLRSWRARHHYRTAGRLTLDARETLPGARRPLARARCSERPGLESQRASRGRMDLPAAGRSAKCPRESHAANPCARARHTECGSEDCTEDLSARGWPGPFRRYGRAIRRALTSGAVAKSMHVHAIAKAPSIRALSASAVTQCAVNSGWWFTAGSELIPIIG